MVQCPSLTDETPAALKGKVIWQRLLSKLEPGTGSLTPRPGLPN